MSTDVTLALPSDDDDGDERVYPLQTHRRPNHKMRKSGVETQWLSEMATSQIIKRWPISGMAGFYTHERSWFLNHPDPEIQSLATAWVNALADRKSQKAARLTAEAARKASDASTAKLAILQHVQTCHHSVRDAAQRASSLYMDGATPRSLKQCIAIAAAEQQVSWSSIELYLAGVGVRVLWSSLAPDTIWGAEECVS